MTTMTAYAHGVPSWIDLATPDPTGAKAFYGALFGWHFDDQPTDNDGATTRWPTSTGRPRPA